MTYQYDTSVGERINLNDPEHLDRQLELMDQQYRSGEKGRYRIFRPFCGDMPLGAKIAIGAISAVAMSTILAIYFLGESTPTNEYVLPKVPPSIVNTCSESFIASEGPETCQQICEVAECCDFPIAFDLSCLYGNEALCLEYHASCNILKQTVLKGEDEKPKPASIPTAPKNIDEVCSKEYLQTSHGPQFCHEVCLPARCCYDDEVLSCTNDHAECKDYAPCLVLSASNHIHEDIVEEIETKCDANNGERDACDEVCSNAFCCFEEVADGIELSCPPEDNDWCSQYLVCQSGEGSGENKGQPADGAKNTNDNPNDVLVAKNTEPTVDDDLPTLAEIENSSAADDEIQETVDDDLVQNRKLDEFELVYGIEEGDETEDEYGESASDDQSEIELVSSGDPLAPTEDDELQLVAGDEDEELEKNIVPARDESEDSDADEQEIELVSSGDPLAPTEDDELQLVAGDEDEDEDEELEKNIVPARDESEDSDADIELVSSGDPLAPTEDDELQLVAGDEDEDEDEELEKNIVPARDESEDSDADIELVSSGDPLAPTEDDELQLVAGDESEDEELEKNIVPARDESEDSDADIELVSSGDPLAPTEDDELQLVAGDESEDEDEELEKNIVPARDESEDSDADIELVSSGDPLAPTEDDELQLVAGDESEDEELEKNIVPARDESEDSDADIELVSSGDPLAPTEDDELQLVAGDESEDEDEELEKNIVPARDESEDSDADIELVSSGDPLAPTEDDELQLVAGDESEDEELEKNIVPARDESEDSDADEQEIELVSSGDPLAPTEDDELQLVPEDEEEESW